MTTDFVVCTSLNDGILAGVVALPRGKYQDLSYAFYLLCDGEVIWKSNYSPDDRTFCKLTKPGTYILKAFVKSSAWKKSFKSAPVFYEGILEPERRLPNSSSDGYREFLATPEAPIPKLPFTQLDEPHQDFAVLTLDHLTHADRFGHASTIDGKFNEEAMSLGLRYSSWSLSSGRILHIMAREEVSKETPYIFSGMTRNQDSFIFGQDDLSNVDIEEVADQIGDCTLARFTCTGLTVTTDYFGVGQIFYYSRNGLTCISNRYQLLLLMLKAANVKLEVNSKKISANLSALSQPFVQNFSREMEIKECFVLPVGRYLELREEQLLIHESEITSTLNDDLRMSDSDYRALVNKAKDEIIDNLNIVLKHPKFKNVRVDVTGGMDARMVFGALTHLQKYRDKIHIHTADMPGSPQDLQISLALTERYPFQYDAIARSTREESLEVTFREILSLDLGTYYGRKPVPAISKLEDTIRINGFYGEICARPYYARSMSYSDYAGLSTKEFVQKYIARIDSSLKPYADSLSLVEILSDEIDKLPGRNLLEKFDYHYLFYRNGLHCSDRWLSRSLAPGWGPLQSKFMHKLKHSQFPESRNIKVQLDVTNALNSEVSTLPYGRETDNLERELLADDLLSPQQFERHMPSKLEKNRHTEAAAIRGQRTKRLARTDAQMIQSENASFYRSLKLYTLDALKELIVKFKLIDFAQGQELYMHLLKRFVSEENKLSDKSLVLASKVLSIHYQAQLTD